MSPNNFCETKKRKFANMNGMYVCSEDDLNVGDSVSFYWLAANGYLYENVKVDSMNDKEVTVSVNGKKLSTPWGLVGKRLQRERRNKSKKV